jgi:hypothetical protein
MRILAPCVFIGSAIASKAATSHHIRGSHTGMSVSAEIAASHIAPDGTRTDVGGDSEAKIKEVLCSAQVLSHLHRCPDGEQSGEEHGAPFTEQLYPMNAAYRQAVDSGYACPLPEPFMQVSNMDRKCCIASKDPNIWPNFCPNLEAMGKPGHEAVKWDVGADLTVHVPSAAWEERVIPAGIYRVGLPDVPTTYGKQSTSVYLLATYFVMSAALVALLIAVFNRIADEDQIVKGKQRENLFVRSQHVDDSDADGDLYEDDSPVASSKASSLSPARDRIARISDEDGQPSNLMGQVSLSFGLLPPLPRGRSTNPSSLNSPRLTARGQN